MYDRVPSDVTENRRRLEEAVALFPDDSTLRGSLAAARARWSFSDSIGVFEAGLAVDPKSTRMMALEGEYQAYLGDFDAALRTFATCIERVPTATDCFLERAMIDQDLGNCARVEADTRNALAIEPKRSAAYDTMLANAIVARGLAGRSWPRASFLRHRRRHLRGSTSSGLARRSWRCSRAASTRWWPRPATWRRASRRATR